MIPNADDEILRGLHVFIVEDERSVSQMLETMLADIGCVVAAVAPDVRTALARVDAAPSIDAAILDVRLGGETVYPVADALEKRGVPFIFSTGYGTADLVDRYPRSLVLHKPYTSGNLAKNLAAATRDAARRAGGVL
jgi:DNA-binding NtrC family response regulator